jgi:hypothetical protein
MGVLPRRSSAARSTHEACDLSGDHKADPAQFPAGLGAEVDGSRDVNPSVKDIAFPKGKIRTYPESA